MVHLVKPRAKGSMIVRATPVEVTTAHVATAMGANSSSPPQWTTMAFSTPSSYRAFATRSTKGSAYTPMSSRQALAGLSSGPRMLKTVRTPSPFRTGMMVFIAGWNMGANMKAIPASSTLFLISSADSSRRMPSS